jgi:hypothetical protein
MSTRSNIAILNNDGSIEAIYCHWDGYPSHNGKILLDHYMSAKKVRALLALGDISILGAEIGEKHDFDQPAPEGVVTAYGRDRGETGILSRKYKDRSALSQALSFAESSWAVYFYLFDIKHHKWLFCKTDETKLKTLTRKDCKR